MNEGLKEELQPAAAARPPRQCMTKAGRWGQEECRQSCQPNCGYSALCGDNPCSVISPTEVNQDGQPLMEGKLKEKQVRWKFIKRWKTRYFTLAGNQLLFRKGKSVSVEHISSPSVFICSASPFPGAPPHGFCHGPHAPPSRLQLSLCSWRLLEKPVLSQLTPGCSSTTSASTTNGTVM